MKKGIVFGLLLTLSAVCCNLSQNLVLPPDVQFITEDGKVPDRVTLEQDWSEEQRWKFWYTSQGAHIMPYSWFTWLEQPDNDQFFRNADHMEQLGYLPMKTSRVNPSGLPIGFAMTRGKSAKDSYMGLTCAACHTNQLNYNGTKYLIDGAPTLANFVLFFDRIVAALKKTHLDPDKFERFARRVLQGTYSESTVKQLKNDLLEAAAEAKQRQTVNALPDHYPEDFTSYGRLDAFGNIENAGSAFALGDLSNRNPPSAPVSYPFLWGTHQSDVVQWNASAPNTPLVGPMVRNVGEVVGVFGGLEIKKAGFIKRLFGKHHVYRSTVDFHGLGALEGYVKILRSPRWEETKLPAIDKELQARGAELFEQYCSSCHLVIPHENEGAHYKSTKTTLAEVKTDPMMAWSAENHMAKSLILEGYKTDIVVGDRFEETTRSLNVSLNGVVGLVLKNPVQALEAGIITNKVNNKEWKKQLDAHTEHIDSIIEKASMMVSEAPSGAEEKNISGLVYKARPLNGIWATAPYLHNGSVPDLWSLLLPEDKRPNSFWVGNREFDAKKVGYKSDAGKNEFKVMERPDKIREGNSNRGHTYGTDLPENDRWALLEFMKSL